MQAMDDTGIAGLTGYVGDVAEVAAPERWSVGFLQGYDVGCDVLEERGNETAVSSAWQSAAASAAANAGLRAIISSRITTSGGMTLTGFKRRRCQGRWLWRGPRVGC